MPHNYTLVVKAKDCLFRFEFDFCDFCGEARQAFGLVGHPYWGWKVPPSTRDIINYGQNDQLTITIIVKLWRQQWWQWNWVYKQTTPDARWNTTVLLFFQTHRWGRSGNTLHVLANTFHRVAKEQSCKKLYKLENTCPGQARPHIVLQSWAVSRILHRAW